MPTAGRVRGLLTTLAVLSVLTAGCGGPEGTPRSQMYPSPAASAATSGPSADPTTPPPAGLGAAPSPGGGGLGGTQKVTTALGALPPDPFPGDAAITDKSPKDPNFRTVLGKVVPAAGLTLKDLWWHATDTWTDERLPRQPVTESTTFLVNGGSPGMVMAMQVYEGDKPSGYWIGAKFYSPALGANSWSCVLYKGDPRAVTARPDPLAPYACTWSDGRGYNPRPVLTVTEGTVVTDQQQAKDLLRDQCDSSSGASRCAFVNFGYATMDGPAQPLGARVFNRSDDSKVKYTVGGETEESTKNSFGVEISVSSEFFELFKASVKSSYDHEWEASTTFKQETEVELAPQSVAWMELEPKLQGSEGTWIVKNGDKTWVVPRFAMSGPVAHEGTYTVYGCLLTKYSGGTCRDEPKVLSRSTP